MPEPTKSFAEILMDEQQRIQGLRSEIESSATRILQLYKQQSIPCAKCSEPIVIGQSTLIDVERYVQPYSCSGGDYWVHSEYRVTCNSCRLDNRLLFDDYDLPFDERDTAQLRREYIFMSAYQKAFLDTKTHQVQYQVFSRDTTWVNNYHVHNNLQDYVGEEALARRNMVLERERLSRQLEKM